MSFKEWAHGQNVTETAPFTQLDGKTIAIEARDYVNNILTNQVTREPLLPALGGLPFALEEQIKNQLSIFQKHNISPIFVFDGLDTVAQDRATLARRCKAAAQSLDDAWALYNASKAEEAVAEFGKSCKSLLSSCNVSVVSGEIPVTLSLDLDDLGRVLGMTGAIAHVSSSGADTDGT